MKLREFYDYCINAGADGDFLIVVDAYDFVALDETLTGEKEDGVFEIHPVFNKESVSKNSFGLDKFYVECKMMGCKDNTEIRIPKYNIDKPKVDSDYDLIFID